MFFLGLSTFTLTSRSIETWTWRQHRLPAKVWSVTSHPAKNLPRTLRGDCWRKVEDFKRTWNGGKSSKSTWRRRRRWNAEKRKLKTFPGCFKGFFILKKMLFQRLSILKRCLKDYESLIIFEKIIERLESLKHI